MLWSTLFALIVVPKKRRPPVKACPPVPRVDGRPAWRRRSPPAVRQVRLDPSARSDLAVRLRQPDLAGRQGQLAPEDPAALRSLVAPLVPAHPVGRSQQPLP